MSKRVRTYSQATRRALQLMGAEIRVARIRRKWSVQEVADRAALSRSLVQRIEKGEPTCAVGAVFEVAVLVGVPLFAEDARVVTERLQQARSALALLPKAAPNRRMEVKDDF